MQARVDTDRRRGRALVFGLVALGVGVMLGTAAVTKVFSDSGSDHSTAARPEVLSQCLALVEVIDPSGSSHTTGLLFDEGRHVVVAADGLHEAGRIAVRIGGARTSGTVVARDSYMDLAVIRLEAPSGARPEMETELDVGDTLTLVRFDDQGRRSSGTSQVQATGIIWSRPDHTVADDVVMLGGTAADSGVLADPEGRVAGLVIGSQDGHTVAYSTGELQRLVTEMMDEGEVEHPWIGVRAGDVGSSGDGRPVGSPAVSAPDGGAVVMEVVPGSPAEAAGLLVGDVIQDVAGSPVQDMGALVRSVASLDAGETVEMHVVRAGTPLTLRVEVAAFPE